MEYLDFDEFVYSFWQRKKMGFVDLTKMKYNYNILCWCNLQCWAMDRAANEQKDSQAQVNY